MQADSGFWCMPRALWSTAYVTNGPTPSAFPKRAHFKREHFRNDMRWPMQVNRIALSGVGYPMEIMNLPQSTTGLTFGAAASSVLSTAKVRIGMPFKKNFSRTQLALSALTPRNTGYITGDSPSDSSLLGNSYLRFDKHLIVSRKGTVEFGLTGYPAVTTNFPNFVEGQIPVGGDLHLPNLGRIYFHEAGGMFSGSSRQKEILAISGGTQPQPDPYSGIPFPVPQGWGVEFSAPPQPLWPPKSKMSARDYSQQESSRDGSTLTYGMGVWIDQIDADDATKAAFASFGFAAGSNYKIASIASLLGCRASCPAGPATNNWWREGAPVSLVLDTITDALVYDLPHPFAVNPGEVLDVQIEVPGLDQLSAAASYNIGISFNGFAKIEG
jgi:hypothetical protein